MNVALGITGIILAFVLMILLTMRDWSSLYVAILVSIIVIVTNGMPLSETLMGVYMPGVASFVGSFFAMMVFGAIMGRLYDKSGAATSIARWLISIFLKDTTKMSEAKRTSLTVLIICIAGMILAYGGINNVVLLLTMYPLAVSACKEANIPQRFAIGIACCGTNTFVYSSPFSPQMPNVAAMEIMGTSSRAAMIPGLVGVLVEIIVIVAAFTFIVKRARAKGEVFAYGPNDTKFDENAVLPHPVVALIPLLVIFITFNFLKLNITLAVGLGLVLSVILFWNNLKEFGVLKAVNEGASSSTSALLLISAVVGFGAVVSSTAGYQKILSGLLGLSIHPYIQLIICVVVFAAIAGSPTSAINLSLPTLGPIFTSMGYSPEAIHRIAAFACTTTDSLPCSGGVIMGVNISGCTMRQAYPGLFISTVLATSAGTVVVTLLCALFPALA